MGFSAGVTPGLFDWGRHRLPSRGALSARIGSLTVFIESKNDEVWVAHTLGEEGSSQVPADSPELDWSRWATDTRPEEVEILPVFPDRSLVLRPENPFHLLPGARARVFVRVPLWVRVRLPGGSLSVLADVPTRILSDTWWGTTTEGKLGYWLDINARRAAPEEVFRHDRIICPLDLRNEAEEDLPVEKLLLGVEHLSVFRGNGSLWSDEVRVRYRGETVGSELEVMGRTPPEAPGAPRLTSPRIPLVKGLTARTFDRLKGLPGLGRTE
jgi:hypothetical protein